MTYKDLRALLLRRWNLPKERPIKRTLHSFSFGEKATFYSLVTIFILSGILLMFQVSEAFLAEVPVKGGSLVEGVVGNPRFINPVLALSEADKNLSALIYSGLIRLTPEGEITNDLASDIKISEDNLTYTATIKDNATFQDGTPVTADDVIFTIGKINDPAIKSPKRGNWDGVTLEKVDDKTVSP
ncbi:hypothetical protein KW807_01705, partial [Candidatus Parcubacteria bacterium]|nr:hypothetical protein [Candidatus Parcubacteria bacterium]